jgi:dienelactone hydrolase
MVEMEKRMKMDRPAQENPLLFPFPGRPMALPHRQGRGMLWAILIAILFAWRPAQGAPAIFEPYLTDTPPRILEVLEKKTEEGVEITRLKFLNRELPTGEQVIIYGILARPAAPGRYPGVLVCHGGGGYADASAPAVKAWAKRGYVSFCQDQPGICNMRQASSSGPWSAKKWGLFTVEPDPTCNVLFDGVVAALNGLALLRSQPDVDRSRIGVTGGSWGGYMTTMVSGLAGDRVRAAFSIYGCGFYDEGSHWSHTIGGLPEETRKRWVEHLDAGRQAKGIRAHYFIAAAANDWFFWPHIVMRTLNEIPAPKNLVFAPNDSHCITVPGGTGGPPAFDRQGHRTYMEILWMDYHLKGAGEPFPVCQPVGAPLRKGDAIEVRFRVAGPKPVRDASVWVAPAEMPWRLKWWRKVEVQPAGDGLYTALLPVEETEYALNWFGLATDERHISISTPMQEVQPAALGFKPEERRDVHFAEDFEGPEAAKRWRRQYWPEEKYKSGRALVCAEAARGGKRGLKITQQFALRGDGIRGVALRASGTRGLAFWVRSPGGTGFDVQLMGEMPDGKRIYWQSSQPDPGKEWKRIEIPWSEFKLVGEAAAPFEPLSPGLGQIRFVTPENAEIHIDDLEAVR